MSALPLLLAATIPLRNPFWPVGYHGSHEAISDAPRVKAVVAAPAHEDALRGAEGVHDGPPVALRPGPPGSGGRGRLRGGGPVRVPPAPGVDGAHSDCPPFVREHLVCSG